ncbi:MAG: VOC family protein [Hydrogenophilales bacterium]|jgi:catechol 2,3-dioxygenase-like lactoylglutathione lyase family enzyme|nr:VOC family protein [Hydrogenophilales bacterium]
MESASPTPTLGFKRIKGVALAVANALRARHFYGETLGLSPAMEDGVQVGCLLGDTILMFKEDWYGKPTDAPNPRVTLEVENARETERALRHHGVTISDPVERYGGALVGAFLDSEGNKLWFCSAA